MEAIGSVRAQSYDNWELLVVDDASEDCTAKTLSTIQDSRIRVIHLPQNMGASSARNAGVQSARGQYIAFLDSDDLWHSDKLEKHLAYVSERPDERRISCTSFEIRGAADSVGAVRRCPPMISHSDMLRGCVISPGSTLLVEHAVFSEVGPFDDRLRRLEDWDWLLRATVRIPVVALDSLLTIVRAGNAANLRDVELALERMRQKRGEYAIHANSDDESVLLSTLYHELAACHYQNGAYHRSAAAIMRSIFIAPTKGAAFYMRLGRRLWRDIRLALGPKASN